MAKFLYSVIVGALVVGSWGVPTFQTRTETVVDHGVHESALRAAAFDEIKDKWNGLKADASEKWDDFKEKMGSMPSDATPDPMLPPNPPASPAWTVENPDPSTLRWMATKENVQSPYGKAYTFKIGYLKVPLSYTPSNPAKQVHLKLRVTLAYTGDSADGKKPLLFHNGGPSTTDTAIGRFLNWDQRSVQDKLPMVFSDQFYGIAIAQRGTFGTAGENNLPIGAEYAGVPLNPGNQRFLNRNAGLAEGRCYNYQEVEPPQGFTSWLNSPPLWPPSPNFTATATTNCSCLVPSDAFYRALGRTAGPEWPFPDPYDEAAVKRYFEESEATLTSCYNEPYFQIPVSVEDPSSVDYGKTKTVNFLDYLGSHMLDQDLETLRKAIGADKYNINGISYGTVVGSTYASTYPDNVDRVLLNGNMIPGPGTEDFYEWSAKAMTQTYYKLNKICDNQLVDGAPIKKMLPHLGEVTFDSLCTDNPKGLSVLTERKFDKMIADMSAGKYTAKTYDGKDFALNPSVVFGFMNAMTRSEHASAKWLEMIDVVSGLTSTNATIRKYMTIGLLDTFCGESPPHADGPMELPPHNIALDQPPTLLTQSFQQYSWYWYGTCTKNVLDQGGPLQPSSMTAVDYSNRFTVAVAHELYKSTKAKYGGAAMFMANIQAPFLFWPAPSTPVTFGWRQEIPALIVGNLYDGATPFAGTMWMRRGFPGSVMLTWQGIGHAIVEDGADYDPDGVKGCIALMDRYMLTGKQPTDGSTCRNQKKIMRPPPA